METEILLVPPEERFEPCDCCEFNPTDWHWRNATLTIRKCMDTCVYCGEKFPRASRLRRHLKDSRKHKDQRLTVVKEDAGRRPWKITKTHKNIDNCSPKHKSNARSDHAPNFFTKISTHDEQILYLEREGFDKREVETFRGLKLSAADDIPLEVRQLWEEYNGGVPEIFDARRCWVATPPTDAELLEATIDQIYKSKSDPSLVCSVIHRGDPDNNIGPMRAVAQLAFPDLWNPLKLLDLRLPIVRNVMLKLPKGLSAGASEPDNLQMMLTTKYSSSELHFDNGEGFSVIPGGAGKKFFATFVNSPRNIKLFKSTEGREAKLDEIGRDMEGGITYTIDSGEAIYLPSHCFHAVWTGKGCFLVSFDFLRPKSVKGYSRIISAGLDRYIGENHQRDLFDRFLAAFEFAIENGRVYDALFSWIELLDRTREWARENPKWSKEAISLCEAFLSSSASRGQICPCGESQGKEFRQHFRVSHFLAVSRKPCYDEKSKNPRKRRHRQYNE
ncbi:hypothetical protein B0O99DRAFT_694057 [Bisporella sp. PMI_857]|nr:hypothetical protein B0O99DRAFT_694057 [Bisporella sp. PMI_857]